MSYSWGSLHLHVCMQFWIGASGITFTIIHPHVHSCTLLLLLLEYMYIAKPFTFVYCTMYVSYNVPIKSVARDPAGRRWSRCPTNRKTSYQDPVCTQPSILIDMECSPRVVWRHHVPYLRHGGEIAGFSPTYAASTGLQRRLPRKNKWYSSTATCPPSEQRRTVGLQGHQAQPA